MVESFGAVKTSSKEVVEDNANFEEIEIADPNAPQEETPTEEPKEEPKETPKEKPVENYTDEDLESEFENSSVTNPVGDKKKKEKI